MALRYKSGRFMRISSTCVKFVFINFSNSDDLKKRTRAGRRAWARVRRIPLLMDPEKSRGLPRDGFPPLGFITDPHGGLRPFQSKSTCLHVINFEALSPGLSLAEGLDT